MKILSIQTKNVRADREFTHLLAKIAKIQTLYFFLSITRLLGLMLGLFKPDGIEFG